MRKQFKFYRLTQDLKNPEHDKRHHYGAQAIPMFRAGAMFRAGINEEHEYADSVLVLLDEGKTVYLGPKGIDLFMKHCEEGQPQTVDEAMLVADLGVNCCDILLRRLYKDGVVTLDQIMAAARSAFDE
jgi:hypothetical protein